MANNFEQLRDKLKEIFQLDRGDLDFGIYRIMNTKRGEVTRYLDQDLQPQVKAILGQLDGANRKEMEEELQKAVAAAQELGADPETLPKVKDLREKMKSAVDVDGLEKEIFSDLYNFFSRYYEEGDFLSLRRYKAGVYAIPYEGEEVKLHWANADQYYIKTSEYFTHYAFKLEDGKRVHFRLTKASTEQNNNKAQNGKERRFMLSEENPVSVENGELFIGMEYRIDDQGRKQEEISRETAQAVLAHKDIGQWKLQLARPAPTGREPERTVLEKHLQDYTARNTFDYFIHKDLGTFMRRELDFFIKNEVLVLDDIIDRKPKDFEKRLAKLNALRTIGHKIITFLAQLEDFQKKLWLKKKFVIETQYCITLDRVPESLYPEIAKNDAQREEWIRLFAIDELKGDLAGGVGYSKPLKPEFLKANPYLLLDTRFFDADFKRRLLAEIDDLDEQTDGLLINADNFHALQFLQTKYSEKARCIYIDPPYNTSATEILYKNSYKHSSWISLMQHRLELARHLMMKDGIICTTIDDYEIYRLWHLLSESFGEENHLGTALVRNNPQGRSTVRGFAVNHEFALFFANTDEVKGVGRLSHTSEQSARYGEQDGEGTPYGWENFRKTGTDSNRADRRKQYYPIYWDGQNLRIPEMEWDDVTKDWINIEPAKTNEKVFWPITHTNQQKVWKWGADRVLKEISALKVDKGNGSEPQIFRKNYLNMAGSLPGTWWDKAKYAAGSHGTNLLTNLFGEGHLFQFPKSVYAVEDCLRVSGIKESGIVVDFFAGSGTTAHAVININREDDLSKKYILVEMGEYFDTVTKPRVQKAIYSKDWKDGKPVSREGSSHCFKYIRLESYEDTLNNLVLQRKPEQQTALDMSPDIREPYLLSYMLNMESRNSLLNVAAFDNPFDYQMNITRQDETRRMKVDLVETFNYLIGLTVENIDVIRNVQVIKGRSPKGERVLVLWRNVKEVDNDKLDEWFRKQGYNTRDMEFDAIYVNGDNNLENLKQGDERWKVRLIEETFHRLMFAGTEE